MENIEPSSPHSSSIARLAALVDRLRPPSSRDAAAAAANIEREIERLRSRRDEAVRLGDDLRSLLALPRQGGFYAETGVRSALGFWLELAQRLGRRLLPPAPQPTSLHDALQQVLGRRSDYRWIAAVDDRLWLKLARALSLATVGAGDTAAGDSAIAANLLEAARMLSYRLAGAALDRELLRADPALERYESPFLAQNAALMPLFERARRGGALPGSDEVRDIDVLLDQCDTALDRVRRGAGESGISVRLTYLLARMRQLIDRLRGLLDLTLPAEQPAAAVVLLKTLCAAVQQRYRVGKFIGENLSLLARNVTDHASRHGEHYIAEEPGAWRAMARSAAGGGAIIALMALVKIQLAQLHLPPLTEGIAFGLNYAIGFVLIHLLGFVVATKQPAMTASSIAATLEEARPRELERLGDFAQNVIRTQFVAVLGNVGLAVPVACLIALAWPLLFGTAVASPEKLGHMLDEIHPLHSGALFFAAVAGVGLFLSGLVSGYFDNQARYHRLAQRIAVAPWLARCGAERARRFGGYLDTHYGAILGNGFFGMYLGLVGVLGILTGLPVDIRHVAFSAANLGTASVSLGLATVAPLLPWAVLGVAAIALVNLAVSFALALYVAMRSRQVGSLQMLRLGKLLLQRFLHRPLAFFTPPPGA